MDGILEYYRATGEKRCLDAIIAIHAKLAQSELNPLGDVGFVDKLIGASHYPNTATEVCDAIHWIRLSYDLFLVTGDDKYLDYMELAYFNAFLAGVYRDGTWTAFAVRGSVHHEANSQCNCAFNHCCVNNAPRTFMDMASATVTRDNDGVFQVNFYQDATATLDGVTFVISGNYPIGNTVTISVSDPAAKVRFRKPNWCRKLDVTQTAGEYTLVFDMNPRIVNRSEENIAADANSKTAWPYKRYQLANCPNESDPLLKHYRETMAATMMNGPLVLARACQAGTKQEQLYDDATVNNQNCTLKLTPKDPANCWGIWQAEILKGDKLVKSFPVCDLQSAADFSLYGYCADTFSIWV
ncbi:MAG: glycoside hydrolase family 127 protein [Lentisphaeria bacterium]|nr:glycoside hydrolase family 127 protein [Lentisphaeria bacterium]